MKASGSGVDNWQGEAAFAADYAELIRLARTLGTDQTPQPAIFVCTCAPLLKHGAYGLTQSLVNKVLPPLVRRIARDNAALLIDFFEALDGGNADTVPAEGVTAEFAQAHPTGLALYYKDDKWCDNAHPADDGFVRQAEVASAAILGWRRREHMGWGVLAWDKTNAAVAVALLVTLAAVSAGALSLWRGGGRHT